MRTFVTVIILQTKYIIVFFAEKPEGEVEEVETTTMLVSIVPTEEEMTTLPPDSGKSFSFLKNC